MKKCIGCKQPMIDVSAQNPVFDSAHECWNPACGLSVNPVNGVHDMNPDDCEHWNLADRETCANCGFVEGVMVECDDRCNAHLDPRTMSEARVTIHHYRYHHLQGGCAHGH